MSDQARTLAILGFHKIGQPPPNGWESWFYIPEDIFVAQLNTVARNAWTVIDVELFLHGLDVPQSLPERAALITFDDGYESLLDIAVPRLLQFGYPAIAFVPTAFIGGTNGFDSDNEPEEPICTWDELRELGRQRISVQSHGVSHRTLSQLGPAEQEAELTYSKTVLEEGLNKSVDVFAYPFGDGGLGRDWRIKRKALRHELERTGYRAACLYGGGPQPVPVADRFRLTRLAMGPDTDLEAELNR